MMLKLKDVLARYGVTKPTIYRWMKEGLFPAPTRIGPKTVRWSEKVLDEYDKKCVIRSVWSDDGLHLDYY